MSISLNDSRSLFAEDLDDKIRHDLIAGALSRQPHIVRKNKNYNIYNFDTAIEGVTGRIGRPDVVELSRPTPDGKRLQDVIEDTTEWVYFAFGGVGENLLVVQWKPVFFGGTEEGLSDILELLIQRGLDDERYQVSVVPKTDRQDFWNAVRAADKIYSLDLVARVPNPLRGSSEFADIVEYNYKLFNATEFNSGIKNEEGLIDIPEGEESVDQQVRFVADGGGEWQLEVSDNDGERRRVSSKNPEITKSIKLDVVEKGEKNLIDYLAKIFDLIRRKLT